MKKIILLTILLSTSLYNVCAQNGNTQTYPELEKTKAVKLGIWGKISTSGRNHDYHTNHFSLNLVGGGSKNEYGFTFSTIASGITHQAYGVQIVGVYSQMGEGRGLGVGGAVHIANDYRGLSVSGAYNSAKVMRGVQIGGVTFSEDAKGAQVGFLNVTEQIYGLQIGVINMAADGYPIQIGAVNTIKTKGLQIGAVNFAEHNDYPIGWINIIKGGHRSLALEVDELGSLTANFRSGGGVMYGIVGIGYNFKGDAHHMVLQGGWGARVGICKWLDVNAELMASWLVKANADYNYETDEGSRNRGRDYDHKSIFKPSFRLFPTVHIGKHFSIYGGPTLSYMQTHEPDNKDLLRKKVLWSNNHVNSYHQLYIGYMGGVRYNF